MAAEPGRNETTGSASRSSAAAPEGRGNPALQMLGLPKLRARLPSRNWLIFLTLTSSFAATVIYDRRRKREAQQRWCDAVSHLSRAPLSTQSMPRKVTVFLAAPPGDGLRVAREYFREYVRPVLVAAALDWDVIEGRREGDVRAGFAESIRNIRRKNGETSTTVAENDLVEELREKLQVSNEAGALDLVIGRHTWKEYVRGLHEGWLGPLDPPKEPEPPSEQAPDLNGPTLDQDQSTNTESSITATGEEPKAEEAKSESESESGTTEKEKEKEKDQKETEKAKPSPTPPYILPDAYASARLGTTAPPAFDVGTALPFPHILGFLNFPIRIARFLNRRKQADDSGRLVASLILAGSNSGTTGGGGGGSEGRPYHNSPADDPEHPWEQQRLLADEERDWHKSARASSPEGEEGRERPWREKMAIDERIAERMRTPEIVADEHTAWQQDSGGGAGNSREWKGGAERPERVPWGRWFRESILGLETEEEPKCKGWEDGLKRGEEEAD